MNSADNFKMYCICGALASVVMSSGGIYICKKCGHEVDDEPSRSQQTYPFMKRIGSPYTINGSSVSTGSYVSLPSPSAPPDGTD